MAVSGSGLLATLGATGGLAASENIFAFAITLGGFNSEEFSAGGIAKLRS